jgi:hypothetical protein
MNVVPGAMSSVLPASDFGARRYRQLQNPTTHEVPLRRLDGMLDEALEGIPDPRPFLKLDTQGFDLEVFAGSATVPPSIVAMQSRSLSSRSTSACRACRSRSRCTRRRARCGPPSIPSPGSTETGRVLEYDCIMVRPSARA